MASIHTRTGKAAQSTIYYMHVRVVNFQDDIFYNHYYYHYYYYLISVQCAFLRWNCVCWHEVECYLWQHNFLHIISNLTIRYFSLYSTNLHLTQNQTTKMHRLTHIFSVKQTNTGSYGPSLLPLLCNNQSPSLFLFASSFSFHHIEMSSITPRYPRTECYQVQ